MRHAKHAFWLFAMAAMLSACASIQALQNPQQAVFAAKQNYAVALSIAVAYKKLPTCTPTSPGLCANPDVVKTLQKVDDASAALLNGAERTVRMQGSGANAQTAIKAANEAVAAFTTITSTLTIK